MPSPTHHDLGVAGRLSAAMFILGYNHSEETASVSLSYLPTALGVFSLSFV